jgi:hypothetical protein
MILEICWTLLAWALILPGIYSLGSVLKKFVPTEDNQLRGIFYLAAGLILFSYSVVALHFANLLNPAAVWSLSALLFLISCLKLRDFSNWVLGWKTLFSSKTHLDKILILLSSVSFLALLLGTLTPEIGGDALTYQLNLPKEFLRRGSLNPIPFDDNSLFPLLMNNLYLIGLATGGVFAAKLFHFMTGLLLSLTVAQVIKLETQDSRLGLFLGLILWVTPAVFNMLSTTYVDVSVAAFLFWAFLAKILSYRQPSIRGIFLSGFFAGAAIAVKYLSLTGVVALIVTGLICELVIERQKFRTLLAEANLWLLGIVLACGYWLARNWLLTGNPFYPYWGFLFGAEQRPPIDYYDMGLGKDLWAYLSAFLNMVLYPERFGMFATRISPIFFLLIPFAVYAALRVKKSWPYFLFFLTLYTIWFSLVQADRWVIPILPPLLIAAAFGLKSAGGQTRILLKRGGILIGLALLTLETLAGVYHYRYAFYLYGGIWSLPEYTRKMERTAAMAVWVNGNLPADAVILTEAEPRKFYINRSIIQDKNLNWHTKYAEEGQSAAERTLFLKEKGVTHLILSESATRPTQSKRHLQDLVNADAAELLVEIPSENIRDERFIYKIYRLKS